MTSLESHKEGCETTLNSKLKSLKIVTNQKSPQNWYKITLNSKT